ncbi:hypothetical protein MNAN1_001528 [Malassezia nana]|uniref:Uncharacterized protein n=1 Tax=Malassezia nana TaxID=180528 RepID=A0AAF0J709_9BASI|nr:hypothetical protein MNAN1_001528 [Malassezia nana]
MFQSPEKPAANTDPAPGNQLQDLTGIKRVVVSVAHQLLERSSSKPTTVVQFQHEMQAKINAQLSTTLPYEPMPKVDRKVSLTNAISTPEEIKQAEDDGVLLICYVDCSVPEKESVSFCSGFAVQGGSSLSAEDSPGRGELVISCAHEMESAYMPSADLALFQLAEDAVQLDPATGQLFPVRDATLATLPVSPYPAVVDTELSVCSFGGWLPHGKGSASDLIFQFLQEDVIRNRWVRATLVGYRDPIGRQAETGTYDELAQLDFTLNFETPENSTSIKDAAKVSSASFPMPGSSGGPVVDINTGSVVGIVRGQRSSELGDSRGDAVPAEKVFECKRR